MSKIRVKVTIKNPETNISNEINAIIQDDILKYKEDTNTTVVFSYKENKLIRENNELRMDYFFEEGNTTRGTLLVKELNKIINIEIKTKKIEIKENNIKITFDVEENEFIYKVEVIK